MSKKYIIPLIIIIIIIAITIYIYPSIQNDKYNQKLINNIYQNTNIKDIKYLNKDNNYYIIKTNNQIKVLDLNYKEVYTLDKNLIINQNLPLVYRRNKLYYEERIQEKNKLTYNFYDIDTKEITYKITLGGTTNG